MATDDKYDRQLRLWGPHGQKCLMDCHMLMLNADAVGTETLKNLVLPGIGQFTVMDGAIVSEADMGSNFFVTPESAGKPRAEVVVENLCEMNEDVRGHALVEDPIKFMLGDEEKCRELIGKFQIVVAANLTETAHRKIAKACWELDIPFMIVRAYGMIGYMRIQTKQHDIVESKPDAKLWDLRIANSFKELEDYANSFNMDELEPVDHKHVPFVIILLQVLQRWKSAHGNTLPTWSDRNTLIMEVEDMSNSYYPAKGFPDEDSRLDFEKFRGINFEDNFKEAKKEISKMWMPKKADGDMLQLIEKYSSTTNPPPMTEFGIFMRSLGVFMERFGNDLPLSGAIPDMFSSTSYYTALQGIFERKAASDKAAFHEIVKEQCGITGYAQPIDTAAVDLFVKNVFDVRSIPYRSLEEEFTNPLSEEIGYYEECPAKEQTPIMWYLALRAADRFQIAHNRWPGATVDNNSTFLSDIDEVYQELMSLVGDMNLSAEAFGEDALSRKHAEEIARYGGVELHNTAATMGGIASQEAVKLITHQYTPLNNTYVYNGVACFGSSYTL